MKAASPLRLGFHAVFFLVLCACYLAVLFGMARLDDVGNLAHDGVRVLATALELALLAGIGHALLHRWQARRRLGWFVAYLALVAVVGAVYAAQMISIRLSNNFISALALQNLDSASVARSARTWLALALAGAWLLLLGFLAWRRRVPRTAARKRWHIAGWLLLAVLYAFVLTQQRRHVTLEPDYRQVPLASLVANALVAVREHGEVLDGPLPTLQGETCLADPDAGQVAEYPLQKSTVYADPLPFAATTHAAPQPNVIVIFTEGTSTRLIGAYGGHYPGLTPNIDRLAADSMKVTDYYNHTAATYRGIIGQTSSGYPFAGGSEKGGWTAGGDGVLAGIRRQTLATILAARGYDTYFFEPEHAGSPFTRMIQSLGFGDIYTYEKTAALLDGQVTVQDQTDQLDDGSLFRGLTRFLQARAQAADGKPFLLATYNIGTHAFIPMVHGGKAYGDGHSRVLDKLHNYDAALGAFLDYLRRSPYAGNTLVVFTADHATYPDQPYRDVAGKDLRPFFVDRIPLLIHDPTHVLPATFDAKGRNSLDMAPTLLQLLGVRRVPNSFLGASLFEPRSLPLGIAALGHGYFITRPSGVVALAELPAVLKPLARCEKDVVEGYYRLEAANRLFKPAR